MPVPYKLVKIAKNSAYSEPIDAGGACIKGLVFPAALTGASVGFQVSYSEGVTYYSVYDQTGALVLVPFVASGMICLQFTLYAIQLVKLVSLHASKVPIVEAADRIIGIVLK